MSPSVNACYINVRRGRVASPELKSFKTKSLIWAIHNQPQLSKLKLDLMPYLETHKICLEFKFKFPAKKLWLKSSKTPKKLDVSNRIKAAEDRVCEFLDFDDRYVYRCVAEKVEGSAEGFDLFVFAYE